MDFKQTLLLIINELNNSRIDYGLIGGFAMGLFGIDRATTDLDFLINIKDIDKIKKIFLENGYELLFYSDNVLQFVSPIKDFGEIDIIIAKREISLNMLKNTIEKTILENSINIKILMPEDIIGLKLQAIKNDKEREAIDRNDIKYLMKNFSLDNDRIKKYADLLNMDQYFEKILLEVNLEK
ncbi:MAG: hypothetical protein A2086_16690 [Spirochaetes bacterium GWD1_27_9]|nr:MAG: hypothetical protein A2086_16690 [Spirochaetes bacterium GWD1_27_9]